MHPALRHSGAALAAVLLAPFAAGALIVRPGWREGLGARLGAAPRTVSGAVWIHGASVGEILAATRLLDALAKRGDPVLASTMTTSGRAVLRRMRPELPHTLAPLDHPWSASRALARVCPRALVFVETELWPGWIAAAARRGVPVVVVSGRLSARSAARYRRAGRLLAPTWRRLSLVGARSEEDAARFRGLGLPASCVRVTGDLKLEPPERVPEPSAELAALTSGSRFWIAASTHAPEEAAALDALAAAEAVGAESALVLAPRRVARADEVEALARARGRRVRRRTRPEPGALAAGEVLLLDTLGELPGLMPPASLVFVGGTLAPRGGHNLLEPVLAGRPVLFGPHTRSQRESAAQLLGCGAGQRVADALELARAVAALLRDPVEASRRGEAGARELAHHRGATQRTLALLDEALADGRVSA